MEEKKKSEKNKELIQGFMDVIYSWSINGDILNKNLYKSKVYTLVQPSHFKLLCF